MLLDGFSISELIMVVLGGLSLYGLIRFFVRRKSDGADVNWTPLEAVGVTVFIYFASQIVAALLAGLIGSQSGLSEDAINNLLESSAGWQFLFILAVESITVGLLYLFVVKTRKTALRAMGLVAPQVRDIGYALLGYIAYFFIYAFVALQLIQHFFPQVDFDQKQELGFSSGIAGPELIFVFLSLVILPPLVEELLVRGFLYTGLRTRMTPLIAAIVASIVFAAAHLQWGSGNALLWTAAVDTFVLSMVLIRLRQKTGSLWPGIGVHFIKNGLAFLALFVFS